MKSKFKSHLKSFDQILFSVVLIISCLGLLVVLNASSHLGTLEYGNPYHFFIRQFIFVVVGTIIMYIVSRIDYKNYQKFYLLIYAIAIGLLVIVLIPGIGSGDVRGAKRWINLKLVNLQPSEIAKIAIIIVLSARIAINPDQIKSFSKGLLVNFLWVGVICGLLYLEPHYSALALIALISVIIMFVGGAKIKHFIFLAMAALPVGVLGIYVSEYRVDRITGFLNPWNDIKGTGWQVVQSMYALGSGGIFGLGLGQSKQKYSYLPDSHNDFVLSIWGEELGLVGMILIMVLFIILIWRGVVIATKAPDMFSGLVAIGITMLVAIQILLNIAIITSCFPVTGMPVPFMSYGGTSMLVFMGAMGILLNISRYVKK